MCCTKYDKIGFIQYSLIKVISMSVTAYYSFVKKVLKYLRFNTYKGKTRKCLKRWQQE